MLAVALLWSNANAGSREETFYRNVWNPMFNGQRLDYCSPGAKCGLDVASCYCKKIGYLRADQQIIDYNVGLTNHLLARTQCKGWECNGFMLIRCVGKKAHKPARSYYYRSHQYVFPHYDHYRVNWCYENGTGCGKKAAHSFCRRMGYMQAQNFKKQDNVPATKALGNQRLCFGPDCNAFSHITCYR